eukprot:951040-Amphidinium_carterae.1
MAAWVAAQILRNALLYYCGSASIATMARSSLTCWTKPGRPLNREEYVLTTLLARAPTSRLGAGIVLDAKALGRQLYCIGS